MAVLEIHHAIVIEDDQLVFRVRALAQRRGYEICHIGEREPIDLTGDRQSRLIDIGKPLVSVDEESEERDAMARIFGDAYIGSLTLAPNERGVMFIRPIEGVT